MDANGENPEQVLNLERIPRSIRMKLKPHQLEGVSFLVDSLPLNLLRYHEKHQNFNAKAGCILADSMGLGKTLQVITALHLFLTDFRNHFNYVSDNIPNFPRILIICPFMVTNVWRNEVQLFNNWLKSEKPPCLFIPDTSIVQSSSPLSQRIELLQEWSKDGGLLLISFEMFRELLSSSTLSLLCDSPDIILIDEAHRLRNLSSETSAAVAKISTPLRILVTGYPLQNSLMEFAAIVRFARPKQITSLLGEPHDFYQSFVAPISKWQRSRIPDEVEKAKRRAWFLSDRLRKSHVILRRGWDLIKNELPPRYEIAVIITLTEQQTGLLQKLKQNPGGALEHFHTSSMLCDHPAVFKRSLFSNSIVDSSDEDFSYAKMNYDDGAMDAEFFQSGKMATLFAILQSSKAEGERVVVFTRWILFLEFLSQAVEIYNSTVESHQVIRAASFDGRTRLDTRQELMNSFSNRELDVLFISTLCGEGFSLVAASRVVIMECNWNPSHDLQAALRVYRYGQVRPVYIYRLISAGSLESDIFLRQGLKQEIASWVVDQGENSDVSSHLINLNKEYPSFPGELSGHVAQDRVTKSFEKLISEQWISRVYQLNTDEFDLDRSACWFSGLFFPSVSEVEAIKAVDEFEWGKVFEKNSKRTKKTWDGSNKIDNTKRYTYDHLSILNSFPSRSTSPEPKDGDISHSLTNHINSKNVTKSDSNLNTKDHPNNFDLPASSSQKTQLSLPKNSLIQHSSPKLVMTRPSGLSISHLSPISPSLSSTSPPSLSDKRSAHKVLKLELGEVESRFARLAAGRKNRLDNKKNGLDKALSRVHINTNANPTFTNSWSPHFPPPFFPPKNDSQNLFLDQKRLNQHTDHGRNAKNNYLKAGYFNDFGRINPPKKNYGNHSSDHRRVFHDKYHQKQNHWNHFHHNHSVSHKNQNQSRSHIPIIPIIPINLGKLKSGHDSNHPNHRHRNIPKTKIKYSVDQRTKGQYVADHHGKRVHRAGMRSGFFPNYHWYRRIDQYQRDPVTR